jgi:acyl-CoA synthetase (AMP-forming)/AMP-acid ligase II
MTAAGVPTTPAPNPLAARIGEILAIDPAADALEFEHRWSTWGELAAAVDAIAAIVGAPGREVGIVLRNRPAHVAAMLGVLRAGGCIVTINPQRGEERTRADVAALDLDVIVGTVDDLATFVDGGAMRTRVAIADLTTEPAIVEPIPAPSHPEGRPNDVAVRMLTSGTTGPPKRIDLTYDTLERVLLGAKYYERDRAPRTTLASGVAIVNSPLVHLGGLFRILLSVNDGRSMVLLERFTVDGWHDAVRRHRPRTSTLVPTALRMVLEADLDPADLASIRSVVCGTAPLSPDDADAFFAAYGIPVLISYAATEFGGPVAGWNLADHAAHWSEKRGSVGRAHPGSELRVVDEDDGRVLGVDEVGLLEVKAGTLGDEAGWMRTTDLARIDADGFLFILGRADQAIIRGGFKVRPDDVRAALESHPAVRGAAVVGVADARLGAVPVAVVELRPGTGDVGAAELLDHLGTRLAPYELPTAIELVELLPRTDSGKVDLGAVRAIVEPTATPTTDTETTES